MILLFGALGGLAREVQNPRLELRARFKVALGCRAKFRDDARDFNLSAWCCFHDPNIDSIM